MSKEPRKPVGIRKDQDGDITHVKLEGNSRATPLEKAFKLAERGEIKGVHGVEGKNKNFVRGNPDGEGKNNLDNLPEI